MDEFDDEIDDFLGAGLADLEVRHDLERRRSFGARVEVDLTENTPLNAYVANRRRKATEAIAVLVGIDASDAIGITKAQAVVAQYLTVRDWARGVIEDSDAADEILQGESNGHAIEA